MPTGITIGRTSRRRGEQGYVLLYLLFLVAVLTISFTAVLPALKFERERDQEEEMVHRGVQYSRAVRRYFRKFGSYPASLDALESSNNMRFLRKRYKDPINGKEFRVLHQTDVKFSFGNGIAGGQNLGQPIAGAANANAAPTQDPNATNGGQPLAGSDPNASAASQPSTDSSSAPSLPFVTASGQPAGVTFGGGPIVGVASISTKESKRVYNKKNHYNDWQFVYDPSADRGGLIVGPYQPNLQTFAQGMNGVQGMNGAQGMNGVQGQNGLTNPGVGMPIVGPGASQSGMR